jgi:hypothetical protein
LPNYIDCTSYFSYCHLIKKNIWKKDLEILKYHYSYGICKGTNLETFENHSMLKQHLRKEIQSFIFYMNKKNRLVLKQDGLLNIKWFVNRIVSQCTNNINKKTILTKT